MKKDNRDIKKTSKKRIKDSNTYIKQSNSENTKHRKRGSRDSSQYKKMTTRIIIGVSAALALIFIIFTFVTTNFMGSDKIITETAYRTIVSDSISTSAFVIRDEQLVENSSNGVLVYHVSTGDKLNVNGTIAEVYSNESDAVNYQELCRINDEIEELESLNSVMSSSNVGLDSVNTRLDQKLISFISTINERKFDEIQNVQSELLSAVYRKQIITGDQKDFNEQIDTLKKEKSELEGKTNDSIGVISAEKSGYFVSDIDGYENLFSVDDLSQVSYSDLNSVEAKNVDDSKYIGKVINGVNWYLACPVTFEQATSIAHSDTSVNVKIPYASSESIPAKVVSINEFANEEKAVVILECNYMSPALSQIRNEAVEIQLETYQGLKVPKVALHDDVIKKTVTDENGNEIETENVVQGVYVKFGSELIFKQVYIVYSGEDYIICSETPEDEILVNNSTISLYDEVVVEGDDLYDGKLID